MLTRSRHNDSLFKPKYKFRPLNLWIIELHSIFSNANPLNSQIILLSVLIYDLATTGALFKPQLFESQFQDRTESDGQIYGS